MRRVLFIAAALLLLAGQVWAATDYRDPTGDGIVAGTVSGSAGTRYQAVDDYPDTTPTDYLQLGTTANSEITMTFPVFTIPVGATAITVDVLYYDAEPVSGTNTSAGRIRVGTTQYSSATHNPSGTTYTSRTKSWATNPAGGNWTVDQVNGVGANALAQFGVIGPDSNPAWRSSSIQLQVNYTPPANNGFQTSSPSGRHGAQTDSTGSSGVVRAQRFVCPGSGTQEITEIGLWVISPSATTGVFKLAIFTNDAGNANPDVIVANSETAELSHGTATLTKISHTYGTKPQLTGGSTYWLAVIYGDTNLETDRNGIGGVMVYGTYTYSTWPTAGEWDSALDGTADLGIYAVYQAEAPATSIKAVLGVDKASVKTVDGLAIGSMKSIDGLQ